MSSFTAGDSSSFSGDTSSFSSGGNSPSFEGGGGADFDFTSHIDTKTIFSELNNVESLAWAMVALIILSAVLRFFTRIKVHRRLQVDDWVMALAVPLSLTQTIITLLIVSTGRKLWAGDFTLLDKNILLSRLNGGFYYLTLMAVKVSLAFLCRTVFKSAKKGLEKVIWGLVVVVIVLGFTSWGIIQFTCAVLKAPNIGFDTCNTQKAFNHVAYVFGAVNILTDLVFSISLALIIWEVKRPITEKMLTYILLVLGTISPIASTVRLALLIKPVPVDEYPSNLFAVVRWSIVELSATIVAINLSTLRPLFARWFQKTIDSLTTNKTSARQAGSDEQGIVTANQNATWSGKVHANESDVFIMANIKDQSRNDAKAVAQYDERQL